MAGKLPQSNDVESPLIIPNDNDITLENLNKHTLVLNDEANERVIYVFDYANIYLNRLVLKKLKDKNKWNVIKHPFVYNYINETLLNSAYNYTIHIALYFAFLGLLYTYIHIKPTFWNNALVTAFVAIFIFFLITKAKLKFERDNISLWFSMSYLFTFFTYLVTLAFVWIPLFFSYDTWNLEIKKSIAWLLPIIAIIASWLQCLHILRKSPCGPYIMMMAKIFKSFFNLTIIWITTLICFAFSFQLVMRDSGTHPWDDPVIANSSGIGMSMFQSFTKISAMMIGEVEANDILERRAWVANLLLIMFEIITVILLMNLMISLAVGDVSELRASANEKLLRIKTNYCIEALHLSEKLDCLPWTPLYKKRVNNIMVIHKNDESEFSTYLPLAKRVSFPVRTYEKEKVHDVTLNATGIKFLSSLISNNFDRQSVLSVNDAILRIVEATGSGVGTVEDGLFKDELSNLQDNESCFTKYKRWLIGLNWRAFLAVA